MNRRKRVLIVFLGVAAIALAAIWSQLPGIGARLLLVPYRSHAAADPPAGIESTTLAGDGVELAAWRGRGEGDFRGTLVYLHGVADTRASGAGVLRAFRRKGFDVVAYDSRAHGDSGGEFCTYGYHEKKDLGKVIDTFRPGPVVLIGSSLGGAVALQAAAEDDRISLVVAAESFSSLERIVHERAPSFFSETTTTEALRIAEEKARFRIGEVSPETAAAQLGIPVLVLHGEADTDTLPEHSKRIHAALNGSAELILVPGAAHCESLQPSTWRQVESWIDRNLPIAVTR